MENLVSQIESLLLPLKNKECAIKMKAYQRNKFEFLGISTPKRRYAIKFLKNLILTNEDLFLLVSLLWNKEEREYQYCAIDLLSYNIKVLTINDLNKLKLLLIKKSWWETVDGLSSVINKLVLFHINKNSQKVMDDWIKDENFWVRRSAMIHQLGWRMKTDKNRLFNYALLLGMEKEFFIRKSIGWALRDYARHNKEDIKNFIKNNEKNLSPLTIREAIKRME